MQFRTRHTFLGFLVGVFVSLAAIADECPALPEPGEVNNDTRNCLTSLETLFAGYSPDIEFLSERNALFSANAYADQKLVIDTFFIMYCGLLGEPRWGLSPEDRAARLELAQEKLYTRVPFPPPVADSRNFSHHRQDPRTFWVSDDRISQARIQFAMLGEAPAVGTSENPAAGPLPETEYIRNVPFYITKANRNFVIVASAGSAEEAFATVRRLKEKTPQFDFVAYAPYRGNPYYGIMMATWVPWSVAKQALADAREYVADDAYIWSCRDLGDSC